MSPVNISVIFLAAYLAVFLTAWSGGLRGWLGVQIDLLPSLLVYAGLTGNVPTFATLAVTGGLLFDSLSANPLGVSFVPLFLVGFLVHHYRELILRDQVYAQFVIGAAASALAPVLTVVLLLGGGHKPLVGWGSLWQLIVAALAGGCFTPVCFRVLDRLGRVFSYPSVPETSFRPDREIKRGRA